MDKLDMRFNQGLTQVAYEIFRINTKRKRGEDVTGDVENAQNILRQVLSHVKYTLGMEG